MKETNSARVRCLIRLATVVLALSFGANLPAFAQANRQADPSPPIDLSTRNKLFQVWQEELRVFFSNPNARTLDQVALAANEYFSRPLPPATTAYVTYWMAMAFGQAVALGFDKDIDRCKEYCEKAMQRFAAPFPTGDWSLKDWTSFRSAAHTMGNFYIAFCLIKTGESDDLAIDYLTRSTQVKADNHSGWKYPGNYWFRAHVYQKQFDELKKRYDESSNKEKAREKAKEIPWRLNSLIEKIIADCARTAATATEHLKYFQEEARKMLRKYWRTDDPAAMERFIDQFRDDPTIEVEGSMIPMPLFAVGSENPVKIDCVAEAIAEFWPKARAIGTHTDSGVSSQPESDHEMFIGALNRARQSLEKTPEADFGVGIEGGTLDTSGGMWAYAWVVIVDRKGNVGKGQTGRFLLPDGVARLVRGGLELGLADDRFFHRSNSKQKDGAIGILSDGRITRLALYKPAVTFALLPFVHPDYYEKALL